MDFKLDAFPVDDTVGGIRSTEKIRIIICYILLNSDAPMTRNNIQSALYDNGIANYFEISQAIDNLLEVKAIETADDKIIINKKGEQIAKDLEDELSPYIRNKALRAAKLTAIYEKRIKENNISITKISDKKYRLDISMLSGMKEEDEMLTVSVFVTDSLQAENIKNNFLNNPVKLYEKVIEALTDEPEFKE